MKILYITLENLSLQKGSVVHVNEIVSRLRKLGHHVGLIARAWNEFKNADHFHNLYHPILFSKKNSRHKRPHYLVLSLFLFLYLIKLLHRYDMIYARDYHTAIIAFLPRIIFKKKLVFEINGLASEEQRMKGYSLINRVLSFFIQFAEKIATKCSNRIVCVTPQIASYLVQRFHCQMKKVEIISNGVNTKIFHPIDDETLITNCRKRLKIGKEDRVITFVGNLAPWQGVDYLIQVAPLIIRDIKNTKFLIIGDGILKKEFENEVDRLGLSDNFIFTGMVAYKEIPLYINIADICIVLKKKLKSGYSPIKLYEYMACGKPVVSSNVEGLEFIDTERAGYVIDPKNITSLYECLSDLLNDRQKRMAMGQKGLEIVREKFDWELKVAKVEKLMKELA